MPLANTAWRAHHSFFCFRFPFPFRVQEFNWTGLWATKQGKIVRSFVPTSFDEYRWEFLSNWKRFVSVLLLCIAVRSTNPEHSCALPYESLVTESMRPSYSLPLSFLFCRVQLSIIELNAFYLKYIL